jgi:hypothetical protein
LQANIDRCTRALARNELIHWGKWVKALADGMDTLIEAQCKERLIALEKLKSKGAKMRSEWMDDEIMASSSEGREYLDILEKGIHTCDSLLEELRDKLVTLTVDGVTKLSPPGVSMPIDRGAIDDFNRFIKVSTYAPVFSAQDRLDHDYHRLKLDEESAKILEE